MLHLYCIKGLWFLVTQWNTGLKPTCAPADLGNLNAWEKKRKKTTKLWIAPSTRLCCEPHEVLVQKTQPQCYKHELKLFCFNIFYIQISPSSLANVLCSCFEIKCKLICNNLTFFFFLFDFAPRVCTPTHREPFYGVHWPVAVNLLNVKMLQIKCPIYFIYHLN